MLNFAGIIFCVLLVTCVFTFILLIFLKLFQIEHYQRVILNPVSIFLILVVSISASTWVYTQMSLILSGNMTQFQDNVSMIFSKYSTPKQTPEKQTNELLENNKNQRNNQLQRGGFTISKYADCLNLYQNVNPTINNSETMFFCKKTEQYCLSIRYLQKFNTGQNPGQKLTTGQRICKTKGWYRPLNKYSQDFDIDK